MDTIEQTIRRVTLDIVRRRSPQVSDVQMEDALIEQLGMASLDLAELVAILEIELGTDPFATIAISRIRTVGDLCTAYRTAAT